eukprot:tig00020934_g16097.t1
MDGSVGARPRRSGAGPRAGEPPPRRAPRKVPPRRGAWPAALALLAVLALARPAEPRALSLAFWGGATAQYCPIFGPCGVGAVVEYSGIVAGPDNPSTEDGAVGMRIRPGASSRTGEAFDAPGQSAAVQDERLMAANSSLYWVDWQTSSNPNGALYYRHTFTVALDKGLAMCGACSRFQRDTVDPSRMACEVEWQAKWFSNQGGAENVDWILKYAPLKLWTPRAALLLPDATTTSWLSPNVARRVAWEGAAVPAADVYLCAPRALPGTLPSGAPQRLRCIKVLELAKTPVSYTLAVSDLQLCNATLNPDPGASVSAGCMAQIKVLPPCMQESPEELESRAGAPIRLLPDDSRKVSLRRPPLVCPAGGSLRCEAEWAGPSFAEMRLCRRLGAGPESRDAELALLAADGARAAAACRAVVYEAPANRTSLPVSEADRAAVCGAAPGERACTAVLLALPAGHPFDAGTAAGALGARASRDSIAFVVVSALLSAERYPASLPAGPLPAGTPEEQARALAVRVSVQPPGNASMHYFLCQGSAAGLDPLRCLLAGQSRGGLNVTLGELAAAVSFGSWASVARLCGDASVPWCNMSLVVVASEEAGAWVRGCLAASQELFPAEIAQSRYCDDRLTALYASLSPAALLEGYRGLVALTDLVSNLAGHIVVGYPRLRVAGVRGSAGLTCYVEPEGCPVLWDGPGPVALRLCPPGERNASLCVEAAPATGANPIQIGGFLAALDNATFGFDSGRGARWLRDLVVLAPSYPGVHNGTAALEVRPARSPPAFAAETVNGRKCAHNSTGGCPLWWTGTPFVDVYVCRRLTGRAPSVRGDCALAEGSVETPRAPAAHPARVPLAAYDFVCANATADRCFADWLLTAADRTDMLSEARVVDLHRSRAIVVDAAASNRRCGAEAAAPACRLVWSGRRDVELFLCPSLPYSAPACFPLQVPERNETYSSPAALDLPLAALRRLCGNGTELVGGASCPAFAVISTPSDPRSALAAWWPLEVVQHPPVAALAASGSCALRRDPAAPATCRALASHPYPLQLSLCRAWPAGPEACLPVARSEAASIPFSSAAEAAEQAFPFSPSEAHLVFLCGTPFARACDAALVACPVSPLAVPAACARTPLRLLGSAVNVTESPAACSEGLPCALAWGDPSSPSPAHPAEVLLCRDPAPDAAHCASLGRNVSRLAFVLSADHFRGPCPAALAAPCPAHFLVLPAPSAPPTAAGWAPVLLEPALQAAGAGGALNETACAIGRPCAFSFLAPPVDVEVLLCAGNASAPAAIAPTANGTAGAPAFCRAYALLCAPAGPGAAPPATCAGHLAARLLGRAGFGAPPVEAAALLGAAPGRPPRPRSPCSPRCCRPRGAALLLQVRWVAARAADFPEEKRPASLLPGAALRFAAALAAALLRPLALGLPLWLLPRAGLLEVALGEDWGAPRVPWADLCALVSLEAWGGDSLGLCPLRSGLAAAFALGLLAALAGAALAALLALDLRPRAAFRPGGRALPFRAGLAACALLLDALHLATFFAVSERHAAAPAVRALLAPSAALRYGPSAGLAIAAASCQLVALAALFAARPSPQVFPDPDDPEPEAPAPAPAPAPPAAAEAEPGVEKAVWTPRPPERVRRLPSVVRGLA